MDKPRIPHPHIVDHLDTARFSADGLRACFEYRHFGVEEATKGKYGAFVQRAIPGKTRNDGWHYHELDFHLLYILSGWITFEYEGLGVTTLREGSCVLQPPGLRHRALEHSDDFHMFEVCSPADIGTVPASPPTEIAS